MKSKILKQLTECGINAFYSKTVFPIQTFEPYVHPEHLSKLVKLISPSGAVEVLRYDSTIACASAFTPFTQSCFFYDEPRFYFDFDKGQIIEEDQMGIEWMVPFEETLDTENLYFEKVLPLAIQIAEIMTEGAYQLELGKTGILESIFETYPQNDVDLERLNYYFSRKNKRKVSDTLSDNRKLLDLVLTLMASRGSYQQISDHLFNIKLPSSFHTWLERIKTVDLKQLTIDLTASNRLNYYSGNVFKIYDLKAHEVIISGGMYTFSTKGVKGVGFSVETGRLNGK